MVDTDVGVRRSTVGESLVFAAEAGKIGIMGVIAIEDDDFGIHFKKVRLGVEVARFISISEARRNKVGESSGVNW